MHTAAALSNSYLTVTLAFYKSPGAAPGDTLAVATAAAAGPAALDAVSLQAAVPKYARLRLDPPSGGAVAPGLVVTQAMHLTNTAHGAKPLALRLRVAYTPAGGEPVVETVEVKGLPPGL